MGKKRLDIILEILKEQGYVTVKYLTEQLHYSTATINRDLNHLVKQKLIRRHYGGAELLEHKSTPLVFRYHKMRPIKNIIGKIAAEYIEDSDVIFIDASTTGQCIGQYITNKKDLTVITNNMALVSYLSQYDIKCICLGGKVIEAPYMLGGEDTVAQAVTYHANKLFFATGGVTKKGTIVDNETYLQLRKTMLNNSDKIFFLADHDKIDKKWNRVVCDFSKIDYVICDYIFSDNVKKKYNKTKFIEVTTPITQK